MSKSLTSIPPPTPVIVVCGFLGAGKTTLLQRILTDPQGVRYGVLVNDFGAIDIDGTLLAPTGADQVVLNNGCICCSIQDDLADALDRLLDQQPERVIIETSGVSRPLPVADAVTAGRFQGRARLDGVYCLVDAALFGTLDFAATELAIDQAQGADLVLLNKTDLATPAESAATTATLTAAIPTLRLLATTHADLPRHLLFDQGDNPRPAHRHHHDHDFAAWHWTSPHPIDPARLRKAVRALPPGILRAKGVVRLAGADERLVFHVVGKRADFTPGPPGQTTAIVAIGRRDAFDPEALTRLFDASTIPPPP